MASFIGLLIAVVVITLMAVAPLAIIIGIVAQVCLWVKLAIAFSEESPIAQSVEHSAVNRSVEGSSPSRGATPKTSRSEKTRPTVVKYSDEFKLPPNPFA